MANFCVQNCKTDTTGTRRLINPGKFNYFRQKQPLTDKEGMLMKKQLLITTFCMLFSGLCNWHLLHANTAPLHGEVIELKRQGWKVTETHSSVEARPGIKPYQNLKRIVQVVKYRLNKGTDVLYCIVEYDSQWDTIRESCSESMQQAEKKVRQ